MNYVWPLDEWALKRGIAESKSVRVCHSAILIILPSCTLTQCFNMYQFSLIASIYSNCHLWLLFSTKWICFEVPCYQPNTIYLIHPHKVRRRNMLRMMLYILKIISLSKMIRRCAVGHNSSTCPWCIFSHLGAQNGFVELAKANFWQTDEVAGRAGG